MNILLTYLLAMSVDSEHSNENPLLTAFLDRLGTECASSVSDFSTKFSSLTPLVHTPILSTTMPTVFTALNGHDFDSSYALWMLLPFPSTLQLSLLRQLHDAAVESGCNSIQIHRLPGFDHDIFLPLWIVNCWARLHTLLAHSEAWSKSKEWLQLLSRRRNIHAPVNRCLSRLNSLPLHAPIPSLPGFSTSNLPTFLGNSWLSDDQMNAGAEFINSHPDCATGTRVLNTHFLGSLALHHQRSAIWNPSRPRLLDLMIVDGRITVVLIPVYEGRHWTLLRVNISHQTYEYTDTMSLGTLHAPASCIESLNWWLSSILPSPATLSPVLRRFSADHQADSHSCGVAVLTNAAHLALGDQFHSWTQQLAPLFRMDWFLQLAGEMLQVRQLQLLEYLLLMVKTQLNEETERAPVFDVDPEDFSDPAFNASLDDSSLFSPLSPISSSTPTNPSPNAQPDSDSESDLTSYGTHAIEGDELLPANPCDQPSFTSRRQLFQTQLPFKPISRVEWEAQEHARFVQVQEQCQIEREREKLEEARARLAKTAYERLRKQGQRTIRRAAQIQAGIRGSDGKLKVCFHTVA